MKAYRRWLVVFFASMIVTTVVGVGKDAQAWVRTLDASGCLQGTSSQGYPSYTCPIVSDTTYYGNNITNLALDITLGYFQTGTATIYWQSVARAYDWSHVSYSSATSLTFSGAGAYDLGSTLWTSGGWSPWDYYAVSIWQSAGTGNKTWSLGGIGWMGN